MSFSGLRLDCPSLRLSDGRRPTMFGLSHFYQTPESPARPASNPLSLAKSLGTLGPFPN
jgi:hypothetical protein